MYNQLSPRGFIRTVALYLCVVHACVVHGKRRDRNRARQSFGQELFLPARAPSFLFDYSISDRERERERESLSLAPFPAYLTYSGKLVIGFPKLVAGGLDEEAMGRGEFRGRSMGKIRKAAAAARFLTFSFKFIQYGRAGREVLTTEFVCVAAARG